MAALTVENVVQTLHAVGFDTTEKLGAALGLLSALTVETVAAEDFQAALANKEAVIEVANDQIATAQAVLEAARENQRRAAEAVGDLFRPRAETEGIKLEMPTLNEAMENLSQFNLKG